MGIFLRGQENQPLIDRVLHDYMKSHNVKLTVEEVKIRVDLTRAFLAMGIPLKKADNIEFNDFLLRYTNFRFGGRKGLSKWLGVINTLEREQIASELKGNCAELTLVTDGGDVGGKKVEGVLIRKITEEGEIWTKMVACKVIEGSVAANQYTSNDF